MIPYIDAKSGESGESGEFGKIVYKNKDKVKEYIYDGQTQTWIIQEYKIL